MLTATLSCGCNPMLLSASSLPHSLPESFSIACINHLTILEVRIDISWIGTQRARWSIFHHNLMQAIETGRGRNQRCSHERYGLCSPRRCHVDAILCCCRPRALHPHDSVAVSIGRSVHGNIVGCAPFQVKNNPPVALVALFTFLDSAPKNSQNWWVIFDLEGGATNDVDCE
jgi:hypothetical protein